ncbi:hypothetical protein [Nostoc sp. UHCC 0870]|uniref:hypothetical protein n=1 Tax=Nostoc sp. UHCC 0870 TaxID=2914041 RepID=UPI001EE0E521|nr:hypothetical protein [Nostoc sp. UHCC 0870]UKO99181.1 hypothetical protein L6494_05530 [Nostoc sp. UHCC 0870]
MLKPLLLSGWFRVQPFFNYFVVFILIAPLVAASGHSSSARSSKAIPKITPETGESDAVSHDKATLSESELAEVLTVDPINSSTRELVVIPKRIESLLPEDNNSESLLAKEYSHSSIDSAVVDPFASVELAPSVTMKRTSKIADILREKSDNNLLAAVQPLPSLPTLPTSQPDATQDAPVIQPQPEDTSELPADPIGSPHPIPWKWIVSTQEAIGSKGMTGVRHYRSVPVVSPDGKFAVYSRVQIEVKPEMYNTRVSSVLFVENRETKRLRVMASTSTLHDPLVKNQAALAEQASKDGKIGVLVPVSWSEKSDRFLARRFEGVFNTGDSTDQAVIWDRQKNQANTVAPAQNEEDHEKIAVLLGWSKNEPDHVLFRAGEMGEENWPLVKVAVDGKTGSTTDADQPVTFGDKLTEIWAGPQVASR